MWLSVASFPDLPARTQKLYAKYYIGSKKRIKYDFFASEQEGLGTRLVISGILYYAAVHVFLVMNVLFTAITKT